MEKGEDDSNTNNTAQGGLFGRPDLSCGTCGAAAERLMQDALRTQLAALEAAASPLEPGADERAELAALVFDHAQVLLSDIAEGPANWPREGAVSRRFTPEFAETGRDPSDVLSYVAQTVDRPGITTTSPRFMGYIPGGGLYHAALGDFLAAVSNKYAGFASAGPGAVRMENATTDWLAQVVGFPESAAGVLTSGGSMANLTAIVAAREERDPDGGGAVYMTTLAHHCIDKALLIAGRAKAPRRIIAVDAHYRMSVDALRQAIEADIAAGVRPWMVVASAGTIDTGSVDPLVDIATLCEKHGIWFHVDGAYGGLFMLCPEGRAALGGIEHADTMALDPHKTMFLPYGTGALLARDGRHLLDTYSSSADYIRPLGETEVGPSPADLSPELTRHFRAMRLWLPLQIAGAAAFRAAQSEKILLARYFHERMRLEAGFEVGPPPDLSVVAFRYLPALGDVDAFNERLIARLQEDGRIFLSGTRIAGRVHLRCAILSFRTHLAHIDETIDVVIRTAKAIEAA